MEQRTITGDHHDDYIERRGRPREFDGTPVSVRLPSTLHDDIVREALRRGLDVSEVIRERLRR
jgi:hypothetical protein